MKSRGSVATEPRERSGALGSPRASVSGGSGDEVPRLIKVAVPVPALDSLTYSLPPATPVPPAGARVLVPLGSRVLTGCVVDLEHGARTVVQAQVKSVVEVLDREPFLPQDVVKLATWVADYYACGIGEALATASPIPHA